MGMGWIALSMQVHWEQVHLQPIPSRTALLLRVLGSLMLALGLFLCLLVDHASMAFLVWVMSLAAAALVIAFVLTWRPQILRGFTWRVR